jgi:hypothetical protein
MATRAQRKNLSEKQGDFLELNKKTIESQKLNNSDTSEEEIIPKNTFALLSEDDPLENEDNNEPQEENDPEANEETPQTTEETPSKTEKKFN